MKNKKVKFYPRSADAFSSSVSPEVSGEGSAVGAEEALARAENERAKKVGTLAKFSAVFTVISTLYAIVSTCLFIAKGWVSGTVSIVLACILAVYVAVFIVLVVATVKDVKGGTKRIKNYKKFLKIFKALANLIFLCLVAVSMAGMSVAGLKDIARIVSFSVTFAVAVVQLGLKIALLIMRGMRARISKRFKVRIVKFVNGKEMKKGASAKIKERRYNKEE